MCMGLSGLIPPHIPPQYHRFNPPTDQPTQQSKDHQLIKRPTSPPPPSPTLPPPLPTGPSIDTQDLIKYWPHRGGALVSQTTLVRHSQTGDRGGKGWLSNGLSATRGRWGVQQMAGANQPQSAAAQQTKTNGRAFLLRRIQKIENLFGGPKKI